MLPPPPPPPPPGTIVLTHRAMALHDVTDSPECPARLAVIEDRLRADGGARFVECEQATQQQLLLFHTPAHVARLSAMFGRAEMLARSYHGDQGFSKKQRKAIQQNVDDDTGIMQHTREASLRAVGAVCQAVDAVMAGEARNAFALVRPPGHHAEPRKGMGFCLWNNVGVAAMWARQR
jgi:acetoin utilization deacetylase AcuC-like enzyme